MATPLAYNPSLSPIFGTTQVGTLAVGTTEQDYSSDPGGIKWWMGANETLGYVIAIPVPDNSQPTPVSGVTASVGFYRSTSLDDNSFIELANNLFGQGFTSAQDASDWLTANGYWNSYTPPPPVTPSPTPTRTSRPTPTPTPTPTSTPYPANTYFFYLPDGGTPAAPTKNGDLMFTTNSGNDVSYDPNTTSEVVIYYTDKSGTIHTDYVDTTLYGGVLTMTQNSNTVILSGTSSQWGGNPSYVTGNYLDVVQASPNPFVSGSPINLVLTVNNP